MSHETELSPIKTQPAIVFGSTKCFEHVVSTAFRQWKADSHCNQIHGYALTFKVWFEANTLDERNWVVDFGDFKPFKKWLEDKFDHKLAVADDDPEVPTLSELSNHARQSGRSIASIVFVEATGCEAFALMAYKWLEIWVATTYGDRVHVQMVEVSEHGGNSGYVRRKS